MISRIFLILALGLLVPTSIAAESPEDVFWTSVKKSNVIDEYRLYVEQYPKGKYLSDAWRRIGQIELTEKSALTGRQASGDVVVQQDKMKGCNAEAKGKKGDERKEFMKNCLR